MIAALKVARTLLGVAPGGMIASAWSLLTSPGGRLLAAAAVAFIAGWEAKARLDQTATLRAIISKQRIDLQAAREIADSASAAVTEIATRDSRHQEIIHDLQLRLAQRPAGACALDDAAARGLRRLK